MKHNIKGSHTTYSITESGDTWIFTKNSTVISSAAAVYANSIANTRIVVEGLISAAGGYAGLQTSGTNVNINVAEGGRILSDGDGIYAAAIGSKITIAGRVEGSTALYSQAANVEIDIAKVGKVVGNTGSSVVAIGDNGHIDNHGTMVGSLAFSGYGAEVHNSGRIKADLDDLAIVSSGDDTRIVNEKSGTIIGGFQIQAETSESTRTVNHGNIRADGYVFQGSAGDDTIKNDGRISGSLTLGPGSDVVDMRGGALNGEIFGDSGDDILITDNAKYILEEYDGEGEDTIRSTVSYKLDPTYYVEFLELIGKKNANATGTERGEELRGNSGDNVLNGRGGWDYFDGKGGDDLLKSPADAVAENRFFFHTGYDHDTIQHLDTGLDTVYLDGWKAIDDFDDLLSHAKNRGNDVVITAGKDSLTIMDMHKADLQAGDFFI